MKLLDTASDGPRAVIQLNRPPLNILNLEMMTELREALDAISRRDEVVVVVLRSRVAGVFSAGADVREHLPDRAGELIPAFEQLVRRVLAFPKVTVSVVEGKCLGGGMEIALACDFVLATREAVFAQPEVKVGVFPPVALALLPRTIGLRRAYDILLTGRNVPGDEAEAIGLITRAVARDRLETTLDELLGVLSQHSGVVMELAKRGARELQGLSLDDALRRSSELYLGELMKSEDALEGLAAFLEKRPPRWKHR